MYKKLVSVGLLICLTSQALVQEINPPLITAAGQNRLATVEELIRGGAPINEQNASGFTALIVAAELGHYDIVKFLIDRDADVNVAIKGTRSSCTEEDTPDSPVACASVMPGAEPPYTIRVGWTALHFAVNNQDLKMIALLFNGGANVNAGSHHKTPLMLAAQKGNRAAVTMLLKHGAAIDAKNSGGRTALYYAVAYADKNAEAMPIIEELISAGAQVTEEVRDVKNRRKNKAKITIAFKFPSRRRAGGLVLR